MKNQARPCQTKVTKNSQQLQTASVLAIVIALTGAMVACTTPPPPSISTTSSLPSGHAVSQQDTAKTVTATVTTATIATTPDKKTETSKTPALNAANLSTYAQAYKKVSYEQLPNWEKDTHLESWPALMQSCATLKNKTEWKEVCDAAFKLEPRSSWAVRKFFERYFTPYHIQNSDGSNEGLITGYYEPLLNGSRTKQAAFQVPLYGVPPDLITIDLSTVYPELKNMRLRGRLVGNKIVPYESRATAIPKLNGQEIVWVDDEVDAFFLQVQGSGRVQLHDAKGKKTEVIRLAYADQNGHPYQSIGRYLVNMGELTLDQASAQSIKEWIAKNPQRKDDVLNANPSLVFFKEEKILDPKMGPKGTLGVPLTEGRSIAIDPTQLPLGAPVYLSTTQPLSTQPMQKLMLAQDTGGAIRGSVRADYFWGFGKNAGEQAGRMKQKGQMWLLLPNTVAPAR